MAKFSLRKEFGNDFEHAVYLAYDAKAIYEKDGTESILVTGILQFLQCEVSF